MFGELNERVRSRAVRGALALLVFVGFLWAWRHWSEPRYHGRGVRSWIEQLPYDNSSNSQANEAMLYFGERALPYLMEAAVRPQKWESGWLARIPRRYLSQVVDLDHTSSVGWAALWRLQQLASEEIERNALEQNPSYPVTERLIVFWKRQLGGPNSRNFLRRLQGFETKGTNFASELRAIWPSLATAQNFSEFSVATQLLAETRDPALTPMLLHFAAETNALPVRTSAISGLALNGYANEAVADAFRTALSSTNHYLASAALVACAHLGVCGLEALELVESRRARAPDNIGPHELRPCDIVEPIIRWRLDTNSTQAVAWIQKNLSPESHPSVRRQTLALLQAAGPLAKPFVPTLVQVAREPPRFLQVRAVRALHAIELEAAKKALASVPPMREMRARTANARSR